MNYRIRKQIWFWLWVIAFIGGLVFTVRDVRTQQMTPVQFSVLHRLTATVVIGLFLGTWAIKYKPNIAKGIVSALIVFSLWQLVSTVWSIEPLWTFYRSLEYLVIVALTAYTVVVLKHVNELRNWMNLVWTWVGILVASAWIGIVFVPKEALLPVPRAVLPIMLNGVVPRINANSLSHMGAVVAIVGLCRYFEKHDRKWFIPTFYGIATMVLSQGRSGLAGFLVGLLVVLVLHRRMGVILGICVTIIILIVTDNFEALFVDFFRRGQSIQVMTGLTGRYYFWEYAWRNFISNNPILGYGAFAGGRFLAMPEITGLSTASSTHNSWIELLVNVGFVGTAIFAAIIIYLYQGLFSFARRAALGASRYIAIEVLAVLTVTCVRSFFTTALIDHSQYPFFAAIGALEYFRRHRLKNNGTD